MPTAPLQAFRLDRDMVADAQAAHRSAGITATYGVGPRKTTIRLTVSEARQSVEVVYLDPHGKPVDAVVCSARQVAEWARDLRESNRHADALPPSFTAPGTARTA